MMFFVWKNSFGMDKLRGIINGGREMEERDREMICSLLVK